MFKRTALLLSLFLGFMTQAQINTLVLQPDGSTGKDAGVKSNNPMSNFFSEPSILCSRNVSGGVQRSFISFDLKDIPAGMTILSAKLTLFSINHELNNSGKARLQVVQNEWDASTLNWSL